MTGILIQLLLSWGIIWLAERKDLGVLGLYPSRKRLTGSLFLFLLTAACCASGFLMRMIFAKQQWQLNPGLNPLAILNGLWWNLKSVLFEELILRGVLLYILIKRAGMVYGILISAIAFGVYHWFSHEVFGNYTQMAITFLSTGLMGLVYAYAYSRSFSLYLPAAIHLGWNITQSVIFSEGNIGDQLLVLQKPVPQVTLSYFTFFLIIYLPLISAIVLNFLFMRRWRPVEQP
ncbi:MAG: CPBP family intramembrane metalloprotease [Chitinophagaceae bacterium]|nr:CPBP family intramembrane metalloprotease [Chitinophagaceae bacterium]